LASKQAAQPTPAQAEPVGDSEMTQEEEKEEPRVDPKVALRNAVMLRFKERMAADKAFMEIAENNEQSAFSNAYGSICSFTKSKTLTKDEEKRSEKGYMADKTKVLAKLDAGAELREIVRKSLI